MPRGLSARAQRRRRPRRLPGRLAALPRAALPRPAADPDRRLGRRDQRRLPRPSRAGTVRDSRSPSSSSCGAPPLEPTVCSASTRLARGNALRWGLRLVSGGIATAPAHAARRHGAAARAPRARLRADDGQLAGIAENLERGWLRAFAITASSYSTGRSVTWVQGASDVEPLGARAPHRAVHAAARRARDGVGGAAVVLPGGPVDGALVRRRRHPLDRAAVAGDPPRREADHRDLDALRAARGGGSPDDRRLSRRPRRSSACCSTRSSSTMFDGDALRSSASTALIEPAARREAAGHAARSSCSCCGLRATWAGSRTSTSRACRSAFRFLTRGLGTRETRSNDLLSLVMFQPDYLQRIGGPRRGRTRRNAAPTSSAFFRRPRGRTTVLPYVREGYSPLNALIR